MEEHLFNAMIRSSLVYSRKLNGRTCREVKKVYPLCMAGSNDMKSRCERSGHVFVNIL
jgi:hypothetical protein